MHVVNLQVFSDSQLVTGHVDGSYEARDPTMALYLMETKRLTHCFNCFSIARIPRAQNMRADALARSASAHDLVSIPTIEAITAPMVVTHEVAKTGLLPNWMEEILRFKTDRR